MKFILLLVFIIGIAEAEEPTLPPEAVPLIESQDFKPTKPKPEEGSITKIEGGYRLQSLAKLQRGYDLALTTRIHAALERDQVCLAVIRARTVESERPDGKGRVTIAIQNTQDYSATPAWKPWPIGKEWETTFFSFLASNALPADAGIAKLITGDAKQVIEISQFQIYALPVGFDVFKLPTMKKTYGGRELDAPWRKEAVERIEKHRKGQWTIGVTDAEGKPLEGAKISIRMKRHLFGFGTSVDPLLLSGLDTKFSGEDRARYVKTVDELFSRVVPENGLRPNNISTPLDPARTWDATSRLRTKTAVQWTLQWAQDRRMTSRGHYLVWGYLEPWASDLIKSGGIVSLLDAYDQHFRVALPFCDPYVDEWDALNHPVPFNEKDALYNVIDPDFYPDIYRKIRPLTSKMLFVNEDTFNPDRDAAFRKHIDHMIAKGVTPDGCGFQSHFSDHSIPTIEKEWETWQHFGGKVKQLTVTEYDLQTLDDELHADHMRDMVTLAFSHPQMTGFVMWGFWEKKHWKPTGAMFKADWTERPAVKVWRDLVKDRWATNADLVTDDKGFAPLRAFYGWFDITIEHGGKSKTFEIKHSTNGGKPVLKLE